jgi:EAL domain-containing protein (putative c-di-GMP-specific phosphodiesterase class I)
MGLEALVRWEHPELGLVSPAVFIPLAEETGLIVEIGTWVLRTACAQTVQWHRAGLFPLSVAVNLSARQFFQPNLANVIAEVLAQTQLDPKYLELEITETTAVKHMEFTQSVLHKLQETGVCIAMDDFGTGYSSLNYLKQLPLNTLKIDRSFIMDLKPDSKDLKIVNAVISLGQGLDLKVVAEGVETEEQLNLLRSLNCDIVQGYLFSRPITANNMTEMLQANWIQRNQRLPVPLSE